MIGGIFMQIKEVDYQWRGTLITRNKTEMIVLHHAAAKSCTVQDVHKWHINRGWCGIGYHYFISRDGEIFRGRPEDTVGAHATGHNSRSIGICFEGDYTTQTMPTVQVEAGKELVAYLKDKYKINKVKGHRDLMVTSCPGVKFPFFEIASVKQNDKENLVLSFQRAATADGFKFQKYGCDGSYGEETKSVMQKCVVKKRLLYKYKNATKLVQRLLGLKQDGLCGRDTDSAIRKFQKENNLTVDGCVGISTWKALLGIK
jgi:N-acetyl-anhydromuramyl-L-alanine amidase AmpD